MGCLDFDGTDDRVWFLVNQALADVTDGASMMAGVIKRGINTGFNAVSYLCSGTAGTGPIEFGASFVGNNDLRIDDSTDITLTDTDFNTTTSPIAFIISKPAGTSTVRATYKVGSGGAFQHADMTTTRADQIDATYLNIGAWAGGADFFNGHVGVLAFYDYHEADDSDREAMLANWQTSDLYNAPGGAPKCLIECNVAAASLLDLMSNATVPTVAGAPTLDAAETLDSWNFNGTGTTQVVYVGAGAVATGTGATIAPAIPTHQAGDLIVVGRGAKPDTTTLSTETNWTRPSNGQVAGGGGSTGADTGPTNVAVEYIEATGSGTTVTLDQSGQNVLWAQALVFRKTAGTWGVAAANGVDSTTGSPLTATMGSDPGFSAGDQGAVFACIPTDVTTPAQFSAPTLTATGMTAAVTEVSEPDSASGNQIGGFVGRVQVDTGPSSTAPTFSATAGGTTTNVRGPIVVVRVRATAAAGGATPRLLSLTGVGR